MISIVNEQIANNDPPMTKVTYERLKQSGYSEQLAKEKLATVVVEEIFNVIKNGEAFNERRFNKRLANLK